MYIKSIHTIYSTTPWVPGTRCLLSALFSPLFSFLQDNTLRTWDPMSLECSFVLKETVDTEMSCFGVLPHLRAIVTGNDDGSLRVWDLSSGKHCIAPVYIYIYIYVMYIY